MTDTNKMREMREAFERTNSRDHRRQPPQGNNYIDPMAQADWESFQKGWQASRQAVVVELPDPNKVHDSGDYCADTVDVLEAQGLRVGVKAEQKAEYQFEPVPGAECSMLLYAQGKPYPRTCQVHGLRCGVQP